MSKNKNKLVTKLRVNDRYVAMQWDYQQWKHEDKNDKKRIDGVYIVYAIRTLGFYKDSNKYSSTINGLALKTEAKILELINQIKEDLRHNLIDLKDTHKEDPDKSDIVISGHKEKQYDLVLPNSAEQHVLPITLEFMALFGLANQISRYLYRRNKMKDITDSKFRNLRFDLLRPLRSGMNDISKLTKGFHKIRKSKLS